MGTLKNTTVDQNATLNGKFGCTNLYVTNLEIDGDIYKGSTAQISAINSKISSTKTAIDNLTTWTYVSRCANGNATVTFSSGFSNYKEMLIEVGVAGSEANYNRILKSCIIPMTYFVGYTTDHGNGAHQVYASDTYAGGVSYMGSNKVKMYAKANAIVWVYVR